MCPASAKTRLLNLNLNPNPRTYTFQYSSPLSELWSWAGSYSAAKNSNSTNSASGGASPSVEVFGLPPRRSWWRGRDPKIKDPMPKTTPTAKRTSRALKNHLSAMASQCRNAAKNEAFSTSGAPRELQNGASLPGTREGRAGEAMTWGICSGKIEWIGSLEERWADGIV